MKKITKFHNTAHALRRISERALTVELLESVVNQHERRTQQYHGEHGGIVYRFTRKVDDLILVAVAEVKGEEAWILTGFFEDDTDTV